MQLAIRANFFNKLSADLESPCGSGFSRTTESIGVASVTDGVLLPLAGTSQHSVCRVFQVSASNIC